MKSKEKDTLRSETQDEPKSKEQVLTFSHQLRREIEASNMVTRRQETVEGNIPDTKIEEWE